MNCQRGLKRIFAVVAVCWIGFWATMAVIYLPENHQNPASQAMEYVVTSIVPVVLLYVFLFLVIPWIGRGFKS
jgi:hypothetical protein